MNSRFFDFGGTLGQKLMTFFNSYHVCARHCVDIPRRNETLITGLNPYIFGGFILAELKHAGI